MKQEAFRCPDELYRGTDFWMLNGDLTDEDIRFQLHEMKDKGVYSFIARTYLGLKSDYPGPRFKARLRTIVETSRELGLKIFLQAGYMPEAVLGLPSDCALRYIYPVKPGEENGRRVLCTHGDVVFVEHNSVTFLDMFDAEAMDYYLKASYEDMWAEFADEYGKTILSVRVDEPSYNGSYLPWTPKLEALFAERYGYELADKVWMLYYDADGCETVRYHYRVLMRDLLEENYFKKVQTWCHAHNLLFSGHLMMEETLGSQITRAQACMPYYRYFDIPGIDVLAGSMAWVDDPLQGADATVRQFNLYNTALQCTSAARQSGKKHILAEMYGVAGENFTFRNMTCMFDSYAALGINHRSVHGIFYTLHGRGKRAYPPHISYYQPFWKKYKNITDYTARVSAFISDGRPSTDVAVLHPMETGYMMYHGTAAGAPGNGALNNYSATLYELLKALHSEQREADLADLASIRDLGGVEKGRFVVGAVSYGTIILPGLRVITEQCLSLLERMAAEGGTVICLGDAPTMLDGIPDEAVAARVKAISVCVDSLSALLGAIPAPDYRIDGIGAANILMNHRVCESGEKFFLYNKDCTHPAEITLTTACKGTLYRWDAYSGTMAAAPFEREGDALTARVTVPEGGSVLLSVEAPRADVTGALTLPGMEAVLPLDGAWTADPAGDNVLVVEYCRYKKGDGEWSGEMPIVAVQRLLSAEEYRGPITLRYAFETADALDGISLALEDPRDQKIMLDGRVIDSKPTGYYCDKSFEIVPVGSIPAGQHVLEIEREFFPLSKVTNALTQLFETRYGVELEPMYLLGRFAVCGHRSAAINGCMVFERQFTLRALPETATTPGELTGDGFPFYVGEMTLSHRVTVPSGVDAAGAKLRLGVMNAGCAEVLVNGERVGDINRAPAEISLGGALKCGENLVQIRLYSTLHNIIGPFHRPRGDVGNTFGGGYQNPDAAWLSVDTTQPGWETHMEDFYPNWTERYNVVPFGIKAAALAFPMK